MNGAGSHRILPGKRLSDTPCVSLAAAGRSSSSMACDSIPAYLDTADNIRVQNSNGRANSERRKVVLAFVYHMSEIMRAWEYDDGEYQNSILEDDRSKLRLSDCSMRFNK